jgi:curved DNA-binding protein CbpA
MAVVGDPRGLYRMLGVPRTAAPEQIRAAFRDLAKVYHPDIGAQADDERFRQVREAYEVLRDPARRLQYDADGLEVERWREQAGRRPQPGGAGASGGRGGGPAADGGGPLAALPRWLPLAAAGGLSVALVASLGLLASRGGEVGELRGRVEALQGELGAAREGEADARTRQRAATFASLDAALAAEGGGEGFVYQGELAFPKDSGDLDEALAARLEALLADLKVAVAGIPAGRDWLLLIDAYSGRAAAAGGVLVDEWGLALLRLGSVTDFAVRAGLPAERIAVRLQAGFAPREATVDAAAAAGRTVELKVLCCLR